MRRNHFTSPSALTDQARSIQQALSYLSVSFCFRQSHVPEHLGPLLHHQGALICIGRNVTVMLPQTAHKVGTKKKKGQPIFVFLHTDLIQKNCHHINLSLRFRSVLSYKDTISGMQIKQSLSIFHDLLIFVALKQNTAACIFRTKLV